MIGDVSDAYAIPAKPRSLPKTKEKLNSDGLHAHAVAYMLLHDAAVRVKVDCCTLAAWQTGLVVFSKWVFYSAVKSDQGRGYIGIGQGGNSSAETKVQPPKSSAHDALCQNVLDEKCTNYTAKFNYPNCSETNTVP